MQPPVQPIKEKRALPLVRGVVLLAFLLVAGIWAGSFFRAEARLRRATIRLMRAVEKSGAESPVALGLAANRLGDVLGPQAILEWQDVGTLASGRQEIVQLFVQIRSNLAQIEFTRRAVAAVATAQGSVQMQVAARYRFVPDAGEAAAGNGQAVLRWERGKDGWRITRATIQADESASLPGGWR